MSRRRPQVRAVSMTAMFGPAVAVPVGGWAYLREPLELTWPSALVWHMAGLSVMIFAGLMTWPVLVLTALFTGPEAVQGCLVPRSWRIRYRNRTDRYGNKIPREQQRSSRISDRLRRIVLIADRNRCGACKGRPGDVHWKGAVIRYIEVDHYRPWILGGLTVLSNCGALCDPCNNIKSCYWEDSDGYEHYNRERRSRRNLEEARWVMWRLRWHRRNPFRLLRAAWAVAA